MDTMSVVMPNGDRLDGVPVGTSKADIMSKWQLSQHSQPPKEGTATDLVKSIMQGLANGYSSIAGAPGDAAKLIGTMMNKAGIPTRDTSKPLPYSVTIPGGELGLGANPDSSEVLPGENYVPQTSIGKYGETAAEFAPALAGGAAGLGKKLVGRVLAPAAGATAGGSFVDPQEHPYIHTALQAGGAVLGAGLVGGVRAVRAALTAPPVAPETTAKQYLAKALADQSSTPQSIQQNIIPGRGQIGAEVLGPSGVSMAATLARRPGTTGEALGNLLATRSAAAPSRIMDDYATAAGIHPEAAQGNIDWLVDAGRKQAAPLYKAALDGTIAAKTPELDALMQRPIVKKAMATAANDLRNGGEDPGAVGLHFDEAGNVTQRIDPTSTAWDLTKKALGQSVERDAFGNRLPDSKSPGNYRISQAARELTSALSDAIPGYGDAVKRSGDYLSLQSAFQAGQKHILSASVSVDQVADHIKDFTPGELDAYKGGIANELFSKAQNARLAPRILNTPAVQDKLSVLLGPTKAETFINGVQQEISLAKSGARMAPGTGSITSDVLLNSAEQDRGATVLAGIHGAKALGHALSGNPVGATAGTISALRHFAPDLLKSGGMTPEVRNALGAQLSMPSEDFVSMLKSQPQTKPTNKASILAKLLQEK